MPRRMYGSGSVYQRASDQRWVVAVRGPLGRRERYFRSKPTREQVREAIRALSDGPADSKLTLGKHLAAWLAGMRPPRVRPSTWVSYDLHVRHLAPLASIPIARLTPDDVRAHLRAMTEEGHSPRSVAYNLTVLRMALKAAERDRLIRHNVALDADPPRQVRHEVRILSPAQAAILIDDGDPLWVLLVTTGLRLGEALALRWRDIDADRVTVTGSLRPIPAAFRRKGAPRLQRVEPKTAAARRTVALPVPLSLERPEVENVEGYVFTSPTGAPRDPRAVSREWDAKRTQLGFPPDVTIHALRHTAVSMALAGGATLDDVKRMVGHSTIAMTSDLYGHMVEGRPERTGDRLLQGVIDGLR